MLVHGFLERSADRSPDQVGVIHGSRRWSYGELEASANRIAAALTGAGIAKGDRVAFLLENSALYIAAYYGALKAGAITVPLFTTVTRRELTAFLRQCEARAVLVGDPAALVVSQALSDAPAVEVVFHAGQKELPAAGRRRVDLEEVALSGDELRPQRDLVETDLASIIYTSGSTGKPKGVTLSHRNLVSNTRSIVEYLHLSAADKVMAVLPFPYVYGKSVLNTHFLAGATVVIENRFVFPQTVVRAMDKEQVTGFSGVPSTFTTLLQKTDLAGRKWPYLRYVTQAGGAMAPETVRKLMQALPDAAIYIMYGATEASARLSYLHPDDLAKKVGSIGKAIPGVEMCIVKDDGSVAGAGETGEIVARGDNVMVGYWNAPEETRSVFCEQGFRTGDLGYVDEEGFFYVVGRKHEMIKTSGFRVSPKEIEEVLVEIPEVAEAAVVGVKDSELGERVRAYVVWKGAGNFDEQRLVEHCRDNLAAYKVPQDWVAVGSLPKNEAGKIAKRVLMEAVAGEAADKAAGS